MVEVAQKVEHLFEQRCAIGSIPVPTTKKGKKIFDKLKILLIFDVLNGEFCLFQGFKLPTRRFFSTSLNKRNQTKSK